YCYRCNNKIIETNIKWLEKQFRANGMSFSNLIYTKDFKEDFHKSRRVEFKVLTKAQEKIYKIIKQLK
ncbi:MAG: OmpA family protein, partial [Sulfurovum sp.]